ncbi:PSD1 and planctomycete cytochrome C domain-containing protein [Alienimonas californiensis]|uniref:Planctomycete cytochrome C n=1 Tax=Alienimonas californiensis TaxID=2527989 RepID=A0A517P549_9PLAN|nr:PSD1 and planctomycete cytochrome C domain-containing protein [Alienimonas californiensis]QDT14476.1 Planctomycete cytochrome C [Alienimonas californiensis]
MSFAVASTRVAAAALLGALLPHARADEPGPAPASEVSANAAAELEFFERQVRPLLAEHCYECHSAKSEPLQAGLAVDSRAALLRGGDTGASFVPGAPDESLLIEAVRYESYEMPPSGKLSDEDIATLERWVALGAPWPEEAAPAAEVDRPQFDLEARRREHWVWQPIEPPPVPTVADGAWPRSTIDRFILAGLEAHRLPPAADADRAALLRRLSFDLTGLPPTPERLEAFLADDSQDATAALVNELLASPAFGERWGRHWLDLVRYAESRGHEFDNDAPNAFQYRDYIIRALNADVPHDQLVREHLAGDLITEPRLHPEEGYNESTLGAGFWFLGEWVHSPVDVRKDEADRFDNMIDVMSKAFLGVTVSCARCHDHKFDAISTADYYALTGFLQSSDYRQVRFESLERNRGVAERLAAVDAEYRTRIAEFLRERGVDPPPAPTPFEGALADRIVVDYGSLPEVEYRQDGFLFGARPTRRGEPYWTQPDDAPELQFAAADAAISDPLWHGLESVAEPATSNKSKLAPLRGSGRTLRTPTFRLDHGTLHCRVRGAGHVVACVDSHRLVAGPLHGETIQTINAGGDWTTLKLDRYVGHRLHLEFIPAEGAQLEVRFVAQGLDGSERKRLDEFAAADAAALTAYAAAARGLLQDEAPELPAAWAAERAALGEQIQRRSQLAMAMGDGSGEDGRIFIRGNAAMPGAAAPRRFLTAVAGPEPMDIPAGSGRLQLAAAINAPDNPLTARVAVNRIWHHLMGRGLVPTTDDFGVLGQRPTHPELLDHLASEFLKNGRSLKETIRTIVLSRTYQLSSRPPSGAADADPNNRLWSYRPPKRLEGEAIRDALLALSGRLDPTMYGRSVPVHLTQFMDGRGRPSRSGPLDGAGRRSIYLAVRRNFLSPFMLTFDTPAPFSTMGRRNVSNVPAQALILLNDPFVAEQAQGWAERALAAAPSPRERVEWLYRTAFARPPAEREFAVAAAFLQEQAQTRGVPPEDDALWADLAHALINTKEFIFLR